MFLGKRFKLLKQTIPHAATKRPLNRRIGGVAAWVNGWPPDGGVVLPDRQELGGWRCGCIVLPTANDSGQIPD